ncbi:MAG: hypothetical protein ACK46C_04165 [Flavobacteriales bacterium]
MMVDFRIVPQYDERAFSADVIARWGDLQPWLKDDADLLHAQMGHLADQSREYPEKADEIFRFLVEVMQRQDTIAEIENAVAISFLEWPEVQELAKALTLPQSVLDVIKEQWIRETDQTK